MTSILWLQIPSGPDEDLISICLFRFSCFPFILIIFDMMILQQKLSYSSSFCCYLGLLSVQHTQLLNSLMSMELVRSGSKLVQLAKTEHSWKIASSNSGGHLLFSVWPLKRKPLPWQRKECLLSSESNQRGEGGQMLMPDARWPSHLLVLFYRGIV